MDRILDHPLAAEIIAEVHGAELRVDHLLQVGVLPGEAFAQQPLAPVRISFRGEELQHRRTVRQRRVRADAVHQLGPRLGDPPHRQQRVDTPAVVTHQVAFQRLGTSPRKALVEGVAPLRRGGGREGDRIDVELLLLDDPAHQAGDLLQLAAVVAQRIHHSGVAHKEADVVAILHRDILVDHADAVARQRIDKGEHRRDQVGQRIRGRQPVGAVIHGLHLPCERDEHLLRGLVRRNLLRIVVSDRAAALDQRIEPGILRVGKLHEALEGRLPPQRIGPEAPHIGLVLPVVALLQQREAAPADHQILQRNGSVGIMQQRRDDHAAATAQQLLRKHNHKVEVHTPVAFGNRADLRHDRYLLDLQRHDPLTVGQRIDWRQKKGIAVALEPHNLRPVVLPLGLTFRARQLREVRRGTLTLQACGHRATRRGTHRGGEHAAQNHSLHFHG